MAVPSPYLVPLMSPPTPPFFSDRGSSLRLAGMAVMVATLAVPVAAEPVDFGRDVRPILANRCFACHGPDPATREAGLRLDRQAAAVADLGEYAAVVPGDADASELVTRITTPDDSFRMPPAGSGKRLRPDQIDTLRRWIEEGATYTRHWAFAPPERPDVPALPERADVERPDWAGNPIDRFVLARIRQRGLKPSPPADPETWLRRVTLDLTGLPPTVAEIDAYLADTGPAAERRVVDRLLHSERYGEAMALAWMDAARYADTDGYQNDGPREMWPWRDWVIDAFNSGMPFDRFTIEQLAGDLLPDATLSQRIATGFNRNHRYNSEAGLVLDEFLLENAVDRVDTTSTVWMGLTVGCARCHDHKFDPVSQREYYQLISFFDNVAESGRAVKFGNSEPWLKAPTRTQAAELAEHDRRVESLRSKLKRQRPRVDDALRDWLQRGRVDPSTKPSVTDRARHRFSFDDRATEDGKGPGDNEPAPGGGPIDADAKLPGVLGDGLICDGTSKVSLGKVADVRGEKRFSIAFWVRPAEVSDGVILSRQSDNTRRPGLAVELADGKLQFFIITRWVAGVGAIESTESLEPGRWTHVALTNDGTQSATGMRIYLDGRPVETTTLYNTNSNTGGTANAAQLIVGQGVHGTPYRGAIDELRYYDRTLWDDEVARLAGDPRLAEIANTPEQDRSEADQRLLREWFSEHAAPPPLRRLARQTHEARLRRERFLDSLPTTMVMRDRARPSPTHLRIRGEYAQRGEVVESGVPKILPPLPEDEPVDRLAFARWLVRPDHPLTARVTVNRIWQRFFGRGLVATPGDFGLQGKSPSHPELLDWLATELIRSEWSVRHVQRLIVTSGTYRQASRVDPGRLAADPDNRWLARGPRLRLAAHVVRDQALSVGGLLSHRQGGPSVNTFQPEGLWAEMSNMKYSLGEGEDLYRRSLYTFWKRTVAPPSMSVLDAADRETCAVSTRRTNTPLQALTLLNETAFFHAAVGLAYRLLSESPAAGTLENADAESIEDPAEAAEGWNPTQIARRGFRVVTGREPTAEETATLVSSLGDYEAYYREHDAEADRLIRSAQVPPAVSSCDTPQRLAAVTALANVLLNLDEAITKH